MRRLLLAACLSLALAGPAHAWPSLFQFGGYMLGSAEDCQQVMLAACEQEFGVCQSDSSGRSLTVGFTKGRHHFTMQCTWFDRVALTIYIVSGAAEVGHGEDLRDMMVRLKTFIDSRQ